MEAKHNSSSNDENDDNENDDNKNDDNEYNRTPFKLPLKRKLAQTSDDESPARKQAHNRRRKMKKKSLSQLKEGGRAWKRRWREIMSSQLKNEGMFRQSSLSSGDDCKDLQWLTSESSEPSQELQPSTSESSNPSQELQPSTSDLSSEIETAAVMEPDDASVTNTIISDTDYYFESDELEDIDNADVSSNISSDGLAKLEDDIPEEFHFADDEMMEDDQQVPENDFEPGQEQVDVENDEEIEYEEPDPVSHLNV